MIRVAFLSLAIVSILCSPALADLTVTVKDAQTIVKVTPEIITQVETIDGDKIGQAVREVGPTITKPAAPAVTVWLASDRDLSKSLVKIKCRTADVAMVEQGVYVVGTPGTHILDVNVISESPLQWDDELVTVTVAGTPTPIPDPIPDDPTPTPVPVLERLAKLSADSAASLNDSATAKALAAAIMQADAELEAMCSRGQCPGLNAAKSSMVAAIERTLLMRSGSSRNVNWLDGWRKPINAALLQLNAVDVPTYRAAMRAVASGLGN